MYILLYIFAFTLGSIALLFLVAIFTKKDYSIHREIRIKRSSKEVYDYLKILKNQEKFSKWVMTDPAMKTTLTGTDGTVGFVYAWEGNKKAGKGEQEIKHLIEDSLVDVEVRFKKPFKGIAKTPFKIEEISGKECKVIWGMTSRMNYPMNTMLLFINMNKVLGKEMEASLINLKKILEK